MQTTKMRSITLAAVLLASLAAGAAARPYNMVLILADDCSPGELAAYGSTKNLTPVLDTLGENGVRFRSAWCTPLCNPTRTMLMTGLYGFRTHRYHNNMNISTPLTDDGYKLFGSWLRDYGYATAVTGKWQLPQMWHDYGFDEYCVWAYENYIPTNTPPEIRDHWFEAPGKPSRYWHPAVVTNGVYMDTVDTDYGPDIFADYAIDFMTRHKDQPFLLYYPMALTHGNFYPTPDSIQPGEDPMINDQNKILGRWWNTLTRWWDGSSPRSTLSNWTTPSTASAPIPESASAHARTGPANLPIPGIRDIPA